MIYFTSDLHFCHNKDFVWRARGFNSIDEMNAAIIDRWNQTIQPEDVVYVLGDLMLSNVEEGMELFAQLNGHIHIIRGNHDTDTKVDRYVNLPNVETIEHATVIKYGKALFYLSHYPTITANYDDDKPWAKHTVNLFGHTHQEQPFYQGNPYMYNVGMDAHDCTPISIDKIIEDIRNEKMRLSEEDFNV